MSVLGPDNLPQRTTLPREWRCCWSGGRSEDTTALLQTTSVFDNSQESLQSYMDRFCQWARDTWTELTPAEQQHFEDHMRS